jgi:hypothetical protein
VRPVSDRCVVLQINAKRGVAASSATPPSPPSDRAMMTSSAAPERSRARPHRPRFGQMPIEPRLGSVLPRGLAQHVFSRPPRITVIRVTGPPRPRRPTKNALRYVAGYIGGTAVPSICFRRRRTFGSLWLGHANVQSTEIYLRADPAEKQKA